MLLMGSGGGGVMGTGYAWVCWEGDSGGEREVPRIEASEVFLDEEIQSISERGRRTGRCGWALPVIMPLEEVRGGIALGDWKLCAVMAVWQRSGGSRLGY